MKPIFFILLVVISSGPASDWSNMRSPFELDENGYVSTWKSQRQKGDTIYPVVESYQAILFFNQRTLDAYLASTEISPRSVLIDAKNGKQFSLAQVAIMDTQTVRQVIKKGYRTTMIEHKED